MIKWIYESKLTAWKRNNKLNEKSKVKIQEYLAKVRILQVLSSFSRLSQLKTTKHLFLINEYSKEQKWIKINSTTLYKMTDNFANSFQRYIRKICNHNHYSKIATIDKLIKKWDFKKKKMFCLMNDEFNASRNTLSCKWSCCMLRCLLSNVMMNMRRILYIIDANFKCKVFYNHEENSWHLDYELSKKESAAQDHKIVSRRIYSYV